MLVLASPNREQTPGDDVTRSMYRGGREPPGADCAREVESTLESASHDDHRRRAGGRHSLSRRIRATAGHVARPHVCEFDTARGILGVERVRVLDENRYASRSSSASQDSASAAGRAESEWRAGRGRRWRRPATMPGAATIETELVPVVHERGLDVHCEELPCDRRMHGTQHNTRSPAARPSLPNLVAPQPADPLPFTHPCPRGRPSKSTRNCSERPASGLVNLFRECLARGSLARAPAGGRGRQLPRSWRTCTASGARSRGWVARALVRRGSIGRSNAAQACRRCSGQRRSWRELLESALRRARRAVKGLPMRTIKMSRSLIQHDARHRGRSA